MVCWTGRRQVAHGKAQSQTHENYDCGHAGRWFRSVKFKRLDSFLFHGLGFWLGRRDRYRSKVGFRTTWSPCRFFGCVVEEAGISTRRTADAGYVPASAVVPKIRLEPPLP